MLNDIFVAGIFGAAVVNLIALAIVINHKVDKWLRTPENE